MLEDFAGEVLHDFHVVAYLDLRRVAYTGCNPRGMILARDKALSKKILHYHRIKFPRFSTFRRRRAIRLPRGFTFPAIVKSLIYESSLGIAQASVVYDEAALVERVKFMHEHYDSDCIVEQFIEGREIYSAVLGNRRLEVFPTWELSLDKLPEDAPRIATRKVKLDAKYQKKYDIVHGRARDIAPELERHIARTSRRICRALNLDGYVRLDYRLTDDGELYFLEANPNPEIAWGEEYASAAEAAGTEYEELLQRIISLGIRRRTGR
jgi:D-alanine-D-alanine ligase